MAVSLSGKLWPWVKPAPLRLKFHHGLGDVLMFRGVLEAVGKPCLIHLNPLLGQQAVFRNHHLATVVEAAQCPSEFKDIVFPMEHSRPCVAGPPTKPRICLEHEFGLIMPDFMIRPLPLDNLTGIDTPAIGATQQFLNGMGPYVACHFQGTWSPETQNPDQSFAERTVRSILALGYDVVILDYDYLFHNPANRELPFVDGHRVRSTYRRLPIAFESLWYVITHSALFIGVVSGPLHAAVCTNVPTICVQKGSDFTTSFYDAGIERVAIVDTRSELEVPPSLLRDRLPVTDRRLDRAVTVPAAGPPPRLPATEHEQARFFLSVYREYRQEMVHLGQLHDQGKAGAHGLVYRTDAEIIYALIRRWRPEVVLDFCTGAGDSLSYMLLALARNDAGICVSADTDDKSSVLNWLIASGVPTDRLLLFDRTDIRDLLPTLANALGQKTRLFWLLDTEHEYEMGEWQLERIIKPYADKSIFAKDDIVAVDNAIESDMGAVYAVRDYICSRMAVYSTNAAFGSTSGVPCSLQPFKGAETRATPGAIPFQVCSRNEDVQAEIRQLYPRWDGAANKMIFFWNPSVA